ncbi:hypothetical protein AAGS61_08465 [Lysinibacillus sp. KU-BSD001]|uniref:hypothetical protein n=1 Tax=Lysinibacillus sp. KU-BSD001 TaxID=3141328 RepID=UPI0036F06641
MKIVRATLYMAAILFLSYSISQSIGNLHALSGLSLLHFFIRCLAIIAFTHQLFQLFRSPKAVKNENI